MPSSIEKWRKSLYKTKDSQMTLSLVVIKNCSGLIKLITFTQQMKPQTKQKTNYGLGENICK